VELARAANHVFKKAERGEGRSSMRLEQQHDFELWQEQDVVEMGQWHLHTYKADAAISAVADDSSNVFFWSR